jgi:hypothetical protein
MDFEWDKISDYSTGDRVGSTYVLVGDWTTVMLAATLALPAVGACM